jgi:MFS superfamily sulfate permease-like transporter
VVGATVAVGVLGLDESAGSKVLGPLPQGLPSFALPWIDLADLLGRGDRRLRRRHVAFADTSVLSRTVCGQDAHAGRSEQEMVGLGAANSAAGLFQGFRSAAVPRARRSPRPRARRPSFTA